MVDIVDDYMKKVIIPGDKGSKILAEICATTLRNCEFVEVVSSGMNGVAVTRVPKGYVTVVHVTGGNPEERNIERHAASLIDKLNEQAKVINAKPLVLADVVDSFTADEDIIRLIGHSLANVANKNKLGIINGELAILDTINPTITANLSGAMISMMPESQLKDYNVFWSTGDVGRFFVGDKSYAVIKNNGKALFMNADGVGTKCEIHLKAKRPDRGVDDCIIMNVDDLGKLDAVFKVFAGLYETKGRVAFQRAAFRALRFAEKLGGTAIMEREWVEDRLKGYKEWLPAYNLSGCAVSIIEDERLKNLPFPKAGNKVIAIASDGNSRSNGYTGKRSLVVERLGIDWHETSEGKEILEYLAKPSTGLYLTFKDLFAKGDSDAGTHMSGGAMDGKFARLLAKHKLFARLGFKQGEELFAPSSMELKFVTDTKTAYGKWPMGTDGYAFIKTGREEEALTTIRSRGLKAKIVGELEKAPEILVNGNIEERTGVEFKAYNGQEIYFSGKD